MKKRLIFIVIVCVFARKTCVFAQQKPWVDFNRNGIEDLYENPDADTDVRVNDLLSQMTTEEKISLLSESSPGVPRLGIDKYYAGNEALHGIVRPGRFTVFPQAIALAAMWNPALIRDVADAASTESRARWNELEQGKKQVHNYADLLSFYSPTVNLARDPRWGRTPETYGEDPYLSGQIGVAFVQGLQGDDPVYLKAVATPKHFAANNEEHNRFSCKVEASEQILRNYYFQPFQALISTGKAHSIMTAYPAINGVPCTASQWMLTDLLRKEWGFNGYVVSDCGAVDHIFDAHHYTKTMEEAVAAALKAGLDQDCGGSNHRYLYGALQQGLVTEQEIDNAAFHVLRARFKLGIFDDPSIVPFNRIPPSEVGKEEHRLLALETARQSIVLLKNNNLLPLNSLKIKSIAVLGINAATPEFGDYSGVPFNEPVSPLEGIIRRAGNKIKVQTLPWTGNISQHEIIPPAFFFHKADDGSLKPGLEAEYFASNNFSQSFSKTVDEQINLDPVNQPPNPKIPRSKYLSVRWQGFVKPAVSGDYELGAVKNGRLRIFINGEKLFDNYNQDRGIYNKTLRMEVGKSYELTVEYANWEGGTLNMIQEDRIVTYAALLWKAPNQKSAGLYAKEKALAAKSDVTVLVMGINKTIEGEGRDRTSIELPEDQQAFIKEIYKANPKTILVLVAGSQLSIRWEQDHLPAIVNAWYPGEQGGTAIAEVLFGDYNPAGRLPLTYYESLDDIPAFDDYKVSNGRTYMYFNGKAIYPFGYGLSYTKFEYSGIKIDKPEANIGDTLSVTVEVKNTGSRDGDEVVQLYLKSPDSRPENPVRQLKGFRRIFIKKGESQTVSFTLTRNDLSYWTKENKFIVEPGEYEIQIGASSADIRQKTGFTIKRQGS
jgi:beta-glucosidase